MSPTLSVCLTSYNHAAYLPECIESILNQSYRDFELIIVDDCSTDQSVEIIEQYQKKDPRIVFYQRKQNGGFFPTMAKAQDLARGRYVHCLASDDYRLPHFFSQTIELLEANPSYGICSSDFVCFKDSAPETLMTYPLLEGAKNPRLFSPEAVVRNMFRNNFWIPCSASIIKRDLIRRNRGFNRSLEHLCDWFLMHKMAFQAGVIYLPEGHSVTRLHGENYSSVQNADKVVMQRVSRKLFETLFEDKEVAAKFMRTGLMGFLLKSRIRETIWNPKYWGYYYHIAKKKWIHRLPTSS